MCIAILNQKGILPTEYIKNSWDNNNEGAGLLWIKNNKLQIYKTYSYKKLLKQYKTIKKQEGENKKIVLHFRISTSGHNKDYINLHPFVINKDLAFVHNGIISGLGNEKHSDTYQFNQVLQKLPDNFIHNEGQKDLISKAIGGSKLIFLDTLENHYIINERLGEWFGGNWYSNNSYIDNFDFYYFGNEKVNKQNCHINNNLQDDLFYFDEASNENLNKLKNIFGFDKNLTSYENRIFMDELFEVADYYNCYNLTRLIKFFEGEINLKESEYI